MQVPVIWTQLLQQGYQHITLGPFVWFGRREQKWQCGQLKYLQENTLASSGFWVLLAYCLVPSVSPSVQTSVCKLEMLFSDNRPLLQHTSSRERWQNAAHSKQSSEAPALWCLR